MSPIRVMSPMRVFRYALLMAVILAPLGGVPLRAEMATSSEFAIIMDFESGRVLASKQPDAPMKPASMAKLMTTYILFQQIRDGTLTLDDMFFVSEEAYRKGGSRMFLEINSQVTIEDLLRGIIVQSGNDAAIVVAEGIAGSEEAFAEEMTATARRLGMKNTVFGNSTGWPDPRTTTTVHDLAILARAMISTFPELYKIYDETSFTYNGITQENRNPLLYAMEEADGLKTGYTRESGYALASSALRDGQRIILVISGLNSRAERKAESLRLMNFAFRNFKKYDLLIKDEPVIKAGVWLGVEPQVDAVSPETISRVMARRSYEGITTRYDIPPDLEAPIAKGAQVGEAVLMIDGIEERFPLVAANAVEELPWYSKIGAFFRTLIFGNEAATTGQ